MPKNNGVPTFVKWAGGKTQLLPQFEPFFPGDFEGYVEPFVGSGAVFFHVKQKFSPRKVTLSDNNGELINAYKVVRDHLEGLLDLLKEHREKHSKDYYYGVRNIDPHTLSEIERAARFLYLNKTCFNGLYRVNSKGKFNVPFGRYKNPNIVNEEKLVKASSLLDGVALKHQPFEDSLNAVNEGDFVYMDPPYDPLSKTANFTTYTKNSFQEEEQRMLARVSVKMHQKGSKVMLSNSDTKFIRSLYRSSGFKIHEVKARRAINSNARKRGAITELLITNY